MARVPEVHVVRASRDEHRAHKDAHHWRRAWIVRTGKERSSIFPTQRNAVAFGRFLAKRRKAELVIHSSTGTIRAKDSHGHDPRRVRG
jgi:hypothetical protein